MSRPSKDQQIVIKQQPDPSPNVTKSSVVFLTPGDGEMVQYISPVNKSVLQDIFALFRKEDDFKYAHKKSCVI